MTKRLLKILTYGVTLASVWKFLLAFYISLRDDYQKLADGQI